MSVDLEAFDLGENYRIARERLSSLVADLIAEAREPKEIRVRACPGWSVHDVLAHLTAVVEDAMAGKLTGPPSDEFTAEQVARRRDMDTAEVLSEWAEIAPPFEGAMTQVRIWPGFLDILAHEHDVRGAVDAPAGRDGEHMMAASEWLLSSWELPVPLVVRTGASEHFFGGAAQGSGDELVLTTTPFELFRFRLGRRSPAQLRAMAWTGDPTPVLDHLVIFGPEPYDLVE
jgi:uncharacterized protein (TIGR03083 family)